MKLHIPIFDIENWKEIAATLGRNKTRTFLTGFGIFWGVAMLAILMGSARGGEDMLRRNFAGFASNSGGIVASRTTIPYKGNAKNRGWSMDLTDVERLKLAIPELKNVVPIFQSWNQASCVNGKYSYSGSALGIGPEYAEVITPKIYNGRFINEADVSQERKVVFLGKKIANEIFPGDPDPVGKTVQINGISYTIIGVGGNLSEAGINGQIDEQALLPQSTFRRANGRGDKIDFCMFLADDNVRIKDLEPRIRSVLYRRHIIAPEDESAVWFINIADMFEMVNTMFTGVNLLALFIGLSTLLAGVIGIGNIMWVIVKERTQEIGIRRAIGAKPRDIIAQVLSEGVALTVLFGLAGITFATLALGVLQFVTNQGDVPTIAQFQMNFTNAFVILIVFVVLGTLAGLIPSIKAMRIKPIEALNDK